MPDGASAFDLGRLVECDGDGTDLTDDTRPGGFLVGSYCYGPCCAGETLERIKGYGEKGTITAWCPPGVAFADWIRSRRNAVPGGNQIVVGTPGEVDAYYRKRAGEN